jgi:hypothetical protein
MEDELSRKRFLGGVELAWTPRVPMMMDLGVGGGGGSGSQLTRLRSRGWRICGVGFVESRYAGWPRRY